jgi:hypothetical protein
MALPKNVGARDRNIRIIVATVLLVLSFIVGSVPLKMVLSLIALVLLVTSYTRTCPAYIALKMDTTKADAE